MTWPNSNALSGDAFSAGTPNAASVTSTPYWPNSVNTPPSCGNSRQRRSSRLLLTLVGRMTTPREQEHNRTDQLIAVLEETAKELRSYVAELSNETRRDEPDGRSMADDD